MKRTILLTLSIVLAIFLGVSLQTTSANNQFNQHEGIEKFHRVRNAVPGQYIVALDINNISEQGLAESEISQLAEQLTYQFGGAVIQVYHSTSPGFSVSLSAEQAMELSRDPRVKSVTEDTGNEISRREFDSNNQTARKGSLGSPNGEQYGSENVTYPDGVIRTDMLYPGQYLLPGQSIQTADGQYKLIYQTDGNLVLYNTTTNFALWDTGTYGLGANKCILDVHGTLDVINYNGQRIFSSDTLYGAGQLLKIEAGRVVLYSPDENFKPCWGTDGIYFYGHLLSGRSLRSPNGQYKLEMQTDGNLALRNASDQLLWTSNTYGNPGSYAIFDYGILKVMTPSGQVIWSSHTVNTSRGKAVVSNDGKVVIYNSANTAIWSSN